MSIRVLIADDHGVLRSGLAALLNAEPGVEVVGEAERGDEVLPEVGRTAPNLVLLDISMPGEGGLEVTRQIREAHPDVRVLILTAHEDEALLREAIRAGAAGFVIKRAVESELLNAIAAVSRGEIYVHPAMTRALLVQPAAPPGGPPAGERPALTHRETEVLRLIVHGNTNRQVAALLDLSVRTVESHRANLMAKLGLQSRVELVRYAAKNKLLD